MTEDGAPKLLDFGIANLLATDPGEAVTAAEAIARLMTPDYASPEELRGGAITAATDAPAFQISNWLVGHYQWGNYGGELWGGIMGGIMDPGTLYVMSEGLRRNPGHILLCLEGELQTELRDGRKFTLTPGMSYQVADNAESRRSYTESGAKLFVVD